MFINDQSQIESSLNDIQDHVRRDVTKLLSILAIMGKDESVKWSGDFGSKLDSLLLDLKSLFKRCYVNILPNQKCKVYLDYTALCNKHKEVIYSLQCYFETM